MDLTKIDHLGIVVRDLEEAVYVYEQGMSLEVTHRETLDDQGVEIVSLEVGESAVELMVPIRGDSPVAKFLEDKGPGIHHVAYAVEDIEEALGDARDAGFRLIDETPRIGAGGKKIAFIHPKSTAGVLSEFVQST